MAENVTAAPTTTAKKTNQDVLKEVELHLAKEPVDIGAPQTIRDLRWKFDQESAKMSQAIYNDHAEKIHETCLKTVSVLVQMLARS
jgi:hypothetical protein